MVINMSKFKKATVILSVDDGRKDAYRFFKEMLEIYNIPATFNIVTDWIDTSNNPESRSLTLTELKEMSQSDLVEIAAHSHTHKNDDEDIIKSKNLLSEWLGISDKIGFASPGSRMNNDFIKTNAEKLLNMGFLYIRTGRAKEPLSEKHLKAREKAKEMGLCDWAIDWASELCYGYDSICVNSSVVLNFNKVSELKDLTRLAIEEKACILFMLHGVAKENETSPDNLWCYDYNKTLEFIKYLSELRNKGEIEVLTTKEAFLKGKA